MSRTLDLIFQGSDVRLVRRLERGKVLVVYLQRGQPLSQTREAWPHELRGHPDGLAGIRKMIAALPAQGEAAATPDTQQQDARPRGFLFAHHAADYEREED